MVSDSDSPVVLGVIQLAEEILARLTIVAHPPSGAGGSPPGAAAPHATWDMTPVTWREPAVFRTNRALAHEANQALRAAQAGDVHNALDSLAYVATLSGWRRARWVANTFRTAYLFHPTVAQTVLQKTREVLPQ